MLRHISQMVPWSFIDFEKPSNIEDYWYSYYDQEGPLREIYESNKDLFISRARERYLELRGDHVVPKRNEDCIKKAVSHAICMGIRERLAARA